MHVIITARHMDLTDEQKAYAEEKAGKLTKYFDLIQEIEVVVEEAEHNHYHVEMMVNAEHRNMFVANSRCERVEACVDQCHDKLERQLTEHNKRHRNRKHPEQGADAGTIRHNAI